MANKHSANIRRLTKLSQGLTKGSGTGRSKRRYWHGYPQIEAQFKALIGKVLRARFPLARAAQDQHRELTAHAAPGSRNRRYIVHVPRGYSGRRPVPLVMVLHGCKQCHENIQHISNFDAVADRAGFVVVYPFVTSYSGFRIQNCWGWWLRSHIQPGRGEVADLWRIVQEVQAEFNIDPGRIHVAGLSAGGGMAVALMVAHAKEIASGATVAGVPYSETAFAVASPSGGKIVLNP